MLGLPGRPINGGSRPRFYVFDDDVTRLVKWHPSPHGAKATYNELVASRLGQLIGAPILRGMVVYVPDEIIPPDHRADGATPGFHFAVTQMEGENFVPAQHYKEIANAAELPIAGVFLSWLHVGDQDGHNQFLQRRMTDSAGGSKPTKHFKLIDMGQMYGDFAWTAASVAAVHQSYHMPDHLAAELTPEKLAPALDELLNVDDAAISQCFSDRPAEWNVSDSDATAGATRATQAKNSIREIIKNSQQVS